MWIFLVLSYQGGGPQVSLAMKTMLKVARFIWVLDCFNSVYTLSRHFFPSHHFMVHKLKICPRILFMSNSSTHPSIRVKGSMETTGTSPGVFNVLCAEQFLKLVSVGK